MSLDFHPNPIAVICLLNRSTSPSPPAAHHCFDRHRSSEQIKLLLCTIPNLRGSSCNCQFICPIGGSQIVFALINFERDRRNRTTRELTYLNHNPPSDHQRSQPPTNRPTSSLRGNISAPLIETNRLHVLLCPPHHGYGLAPTYPFARAGFISWTFISSIQSNRRHRRR